MYNILSYRPAMILLLHISLFHGLYSRVPADNVCSFWIIILQTQTNSERMFTTNVPPCTQIRAVITNAFLCIDWRSYYNFDGCVLLYKKLIWSSVVAVLSFSFLWFFRILFASGYYQCPLIWNSISIFRIRPWLGAVLTVVEPLL